MHSLRGAIRTVNTIQAHVLRTLMSLVSLDDKPRYQRDSESVASRLGKEPLVS
jgi:hypothetical protein